MIAKMRTSVSWPDQPALIRGGGRVFRKGSFFQGAAFPVKKNQLYGPDAWARRAFAV